jgi:hypothetical protein
MQTRDSSNKQSEEEEGAEKRDLELENVVGNLLIASYQVEKLRTRLADLADGFRPESEMRFNKSSAHIFKHNNRWYKLSLRIDETEVTDSRQDQMTGYSSKG